MVAQIPRHVPTMRAWHALRYGGPDVLELRSVPRPRLGPHDVMIAVEATTVSSGDRRIRAFDLPAGLRIAGRLMLGLSAPRNPVLGTELTGRVVEVGAKVERFAVGDRVIAFPGARMGAHAEFCRIDERRAIVARTAGMSLQTAASLAFGGTTALDYLRRANLAPGETVLVIGASGTVGSALVQLARYRGANVTAVTSTSNLDMVRRLGAHAVIDYSATEADHATRKYDVIADAVGALTYKTAIARLRPGGRYLAIAGGLADLLARPKGETRPIAGPAAERQDDLVELVELVERGAFTPLIDSIFAFEDLPAAHARVDSGHKRGSVVVVLSPADSARPA